jgi:2-polyprenyl-3-methyl-5-hydroxy-6-metoxy-1,4-benzoquinol methylase
LRECEDHFEEEPPYQLSWGKRRLRLQRYHRVERSCEQKAHWESVYTAKALEEVSWYPPHLDTSLALIGQLTPSQAAAIIDIGAGASTLVDNLVRRGYANITILDISETALCMAKERLDPSSSQSFNGCPRMCVKPDLLVIITTCA